MKIKKRLLLQDKEVKLNCHYCQFITYIWLKSWELPCAPTLCQTHFYHFSLQYKYFGNEKEEVTNRMITLVNAVDKVMEKCHTRIQVLTNIQKAWQLHWILHKSKSNSYLNLTSMMQISGYVVERDGQFFHKGRWSGPN